MKLKLAVFILFCSSMLFAQQIDKQLEISLANDKLFFLDRYYTNGLFVTYKQDLENSFILNKTSENKLQLNLTIGNETYTPKNLSSFNTDDFDRPFAGWLFGKMEVASVQETNAFFLAFETGITGEESLSGKLQTAIHNFFNIDNPTWAEEIAFKWLVNIKANYFATVLENESNSMLWSIGSSLGSKDIFGKSSIHYYFGKFNKLQNSSRLGFIDTTKTNEFYGTLSLGYKYVVHNTLIQGSIFEEDILFTTNITNHVLDFSIGCTFKSKTNTFKLLGIFNTKETPLSTSHLYGILTYSKDF